MHESMAAKLLMAFASTVTLGSDSHRALLSAGTRGLQALSKSVEKKLRGL
jgi:hypothetical protein